MKKRLLSAALALAMVLTMLPWTAVPVSAATNGPWAQDGDSATYKDKEDSTVKGMWDGPGYYVRHDIKEGNKTVETVYGKITSGFVIGGKYYAGWPVNDKTGKSLSTTFTAIGTVQATLTEADSSTVKADVYGDSTNLTISAVALTNITIDDSKYKTEVQAGIRTADKRGNVSFSGVVADKALTLKMDNVTSTSSIITESVNVTRTITLTNATLGNVTLLGAAADGKQTAQKITVNKSTVVGAPGNMLGDIEVIGKGSQILLTDAVSVGNITLEGTDTKLQADGATGATKAGNVTLCGSTNDKVTSGTAPKVTVNGTRLGNITASSEEKLTSNYTIQVNTQGTVKDINVPNANITINGGHTGNITQTNGFLKLQDAAEVGDITFKDNGGKTGIITEFSVKGSNNKVGEVNTTPKDSSNYYVTFTKVDIPYDVTNKFDKMELGNYGGKGIKGGSFKAVITVDHKAYLSDDLAYEVKLGGIMYPSYGSYTAYFSKSQLSQAIAAAGTTNATNEKGEGIKLVGQTNVKTINLTVGGTPMAVIGFSKYPSSIILPGIVNGADYVTWTLTSDRITEPGTSYRTGEEFTRSELENVTLDAQGSIGIVSKLTNARVSDDVDDDGFNEIIKDVKVSLVGNTITLTGATSSIVGGMAGFVLELDTDLVTSVDGGRNAVVKIRVNWNSVTGKATFARDYIPGYGITFPDENTLRLNNGITYSVNGSGLKELVTANISYDPDVFYGGNAEVEVVVSASGYTTEIQKQLLIKEFLGEEYEKGIFTWNNSPAVRQAVNAAMATISASQVNSWIKQAQNTFWKRYSKLNPTAAELAETGYNTAYLVPYLYMNITKSEQNNAVTATLTPYYRVEVRGGKDGPIVVQTGRTLGALASDLTDYRDQGGVVLTLNDTGRYSNNTYAWQDDTYVYPISGNKVKFTHGGRGSSGLGTVVFNQVAPTVALKRGEEIFYYNNLQAAVDDTLNYDQIEVYGTYTGSGSITMTGLARTITIETFGNTTVTTSGANVTLTKPDYSGHRYIVQLAQSTFVTGTTNVFVTSVTGGSASISSSSVKVGDEVTVTLTPAMGYVASGLTVTTNTGVRITVTSNGYNNYNYNSNSYKFVVPDVSFSSITVTPAFRLGTTASTSGASVYVPTVIGGSASITANSGYVTPGATVGVNVYPNTGYRTIGVTVSTNVGSVNATKVSENYYTFTVPINATTVTVTPSFAVNVTTPTVTNNYIDVPANQFYTNAVTWAVNRGITQGTTSTTFSPSQTITRAQMVTFLWRAANKPIVSTKSTQYVDVTPTMNQDYYNAIQWAISKGITQGVDSTHFGPSQGVTRAQAVTFLWRYEGQPASSGSGYADVPAGDFANAVRWAVNKQPCAVTNGKGSVFAPNDPVSRGEAVTFLYRDITGNFQ